MNHLWTNLSSVLFALVGACLICLVLLQRSRGGGLVGAFGSSGGQSAFGTRAGDLFTRITIGVAVFWIAMAAVTGFAMRTDLGSRFLPG
jgi:preprotein translocase subunit SecG